MLSPIFDICLANNAAVSKLMNYEDTLKRSDIGGKETF